MSNYTFNTEKFSYQTIEIKGEPHYFITGYISTTDKDLYNDVVSEKALKSMLDQIKNESIKLDYDHEAWRDSSNILPVGKIIDAKVDEKGLWVKAELNEHSPKFKSLWGSIRKGFVDAFSIAFQPIKTSMKAMDGVKVRLIDDLKLLNVALTGVPVNQSARIQDVMMKALKEYKGEDTMSEDEENKKKKSSEEQEEEDKKKKVAEEKAEQEKKEKEEKEEEEKEEEEKKKKVAEEKALAMDAQLKSITEKLESVIKENTELKSQVEKLKAEPVMKSVQEDAPKVQAPVLKSVLRMI